MTDTQSRDENPLTPQESTTPPPQSVAPPAAPAHSPLAVTPPPSSSHPSEPKKPRKTGLAIFLTVIGILALLGLATLTGAWLQNQFGTKAPQSSLMTGPDGNATVTQEESSIASVVEKVNPSVVSIVGTTQSRSFRTAAGESAGTGIIVSSNGYVMTNNHVVEGASNIAIVDKDGNRYTDVELVGRDPLNDVAFLKINASTEFKPAELGNSSTLRNGQQVVAIGNALGQYSNTVTSGIVSGTGRPITAASASGQTETLTDLIQTDASINPGNSGGPLLNMAGQVIGINTAIVEDANGIGFAIPINATKGILAGVLDTGKVERAYLGVNFINVTPDVAEQFNLSVKQGAYVNASNGANPVANGSPAARAGLESGDIITKINDTSLGNSANLSSVIGEYRPGQTVTLTYIRNGQERKTDVTFTAYSD